eukprot:CAMPEP_0183808154 /NCGR_PEP_ID=MMETSP0803_2-20130417/43004_1 /TAXON_ID=195967 /ORGANISM="Crustomastix stigmata, Strain CCMP3273" /LENGTH=44 /DNA_ID= /DNA_START= /DNA_END= /DNA_ORIENTATION=
MARGRPGRWLRRHRGGWLELDDVLRAVPQAVQRRALCHVLHVAR